MFTRKRDFDGAIAEVRNDVRKVAAAVADRTAAETHAADLLAAAVHRTDERIAAVRVQMESRVAHERRELAEARKETTVRIYRELRSELTTTATARDEARRTIAEQAGFIAELNRRLALADIATAEARRQHDEQRAENQQLRMFVAAAVEILSRPRHIEAEPKGGSRTRYRATVDHMAAAIAPTPDAP